MSDSSPVIVVTVDFEKLSENMKMARQTYPEMSKIYSLPSHRESTAPICDGILSLACLNITVTHFAFVAGKRWKTPGPPPAALETQSHRDDNAGDCLGLEIGSGDWI